MLSTEIIQGSIIDPVKNDSQRGGNIMNLKKIAALSMSVVLLAGCSSSKPEKSASSKKTKETTASPEPSKTPEPTPALSTDHTKLADKTLSIDYKLLENIPLTGSDGKAYVQNNGYGNDLNSQFISPDADAFEITVADQNYSWLKEDYTFVSQTGNPYLDQNSGSVTLMITGETQYENSDGYYPDTVEALKKNLTDAGYQSAGDYPGSADASGYQVNYYNYSNGGRLFSVTEVLLNGNFSTGVIEVGNPK